MTGESKPGLLPLWIALAASAVVAWISCPIPLPRHMDAWSLIGIAAMQVMFSTASGAALVAWWTRAVVSIDVRQLVPRMVGVCVWMAPFIVLAREKSAWAAFPLIGLILGTVRFIWWWYDLTEDEDSKRLPSFVLALLLQAGAVSAATQRNSVTLTITAAFAFLLAWHMLNRGLWTAPRRHSELVVTGLALVLVLIGLSPFLKLGRRAAGGYPVPVNTGRPGRGVVLGVTHIGVKLFPDIEKNLTMLVVPRRVTSPAASNRSAAPDPFTIPFQGVYWYFRPGDHEPPPNSYETRGDPAHLTFHTTDRTRIAMEARQNLGQHIDLSCCRELRLSLSNNERSAGALWVEVTLIDTTAPGRPFAFLGTQRLALDRATPVSSEPQPVPEKLSYEIPLHPAVAAFDEIAVRFNRGYLQSDTSPRIAIDRFTLVPRAGR